MSPRPHRTPRSASRLAVGATVAVGLLASLGLQVVGGEPAAPAESSTVMACDLPKSGPVAI